MRPAPLLAVTVSAVIGVALGVAGGLMLDRGHDTFPDPLALGVPLHNQPCTGGVLLLVGHGFVASELAHSVAENLSDGVAYLDTRQSCPTAWNGGERPVPDYVTYLGPFDTNAKACNLRMNAAHRGSQVTVLKARTPDPVQCLCFVQLAMPTLHPGMSNDGVNGIWIRQVQSMLIDLGLASDEDATGFYDHTTATRIRAFQRFHKINPTGVLNHDTWEVLLTQGCQAPASSASPNASP